MPFYSAAASSKKVCNTKDFNYMTEVVCKAYFVKALNEEHAIGGVLKEFQIEYPLSEGYENHQVNILEVDLEKFKISDNKSLQRTSARAAF